MAKTDNAPRGVLIAAGMTAGFIGQYGADFVGNIAHNNPDLLQITSGFNEFLAALATGFTGAVFDDKLSLFALTVLSTGVYYSITTTVGTILGKKTLTGEVLLKNYLHDAILVFLLLYMQNRVYVPLLTAAFGKKQISVWAHALLTGVIVSVYYGLRDTFFNSGNKTVYETEKK
ncbi:MAG: hypothetical protein M0R05_01405 [Bacilli bacterium]|nr:hypothetical protein [Bacilli bacterium]MDD4388315.1 hypothetical protein [Bacilli bacterium]